MDIELQDCLNDYQTLMKLKYIDGHNPNFKKALKSVKERHDDINLTINLAEEKMESMKKQL